jgi:hypothetical protein
MSRRCVIVDAAQREASEQSWSLATSLCAWGVFGVIAMFLRRWLCEAPVFEEMRQQAALSSEQPLHAVLKSHERAVATSVIRIWMLTAAIVVVLLMTPSLLHTLFGLALSHVQMASLAGTAALCLSTLAIGAATDRFGIRRAPFQSCCC